MLGFRMYVQVSLEYAVSRTARLLAVDSAQSRTSSTTTFQAVTFCPQLTAFLSCNNVSISLHPVTDFTNSSSVGATFNAGTSNSLMLLQATYQLPSLSWPQPNGTPGSFGGSSVTVGYPYQNEY